MRPLSARLIPLIACTLVLAGCQPQRAATPPTLSPVTATAVQSTPPLAPTLAPTVAPTNVPTAPPPTASPVAATAAAPTNVPTAPPPTASPVAATAAPTIAPTPQPVAAGEQILFLREGDLAALTLPAGGLTTLAEDVTEFAATPDGRLLALVRGEGAASEIWVLRRDTGELWQLTSNDRAESTPSWAPDGTSLVYTSAPDPGPRVPDYDAWSNWCARADARILDLPAAPGVVAPASAERLLSEGCEPAFGPDGRRIVFAARPAQRGEPPFNSVANAIMMVNRQGENGWRVAFADAGPATGLLVYSPAWSPDGGQVSYQRFLGYQALVDINLTEVGSSFQRSGAPVGMGAGWMLPPRYSPDGRLVAVTEHNFSDARGFSGYDIWTTSVLRLGGSSQLAMPSGEMTLAAEEVGRLPRATGAAWSPDGAALAVALPAGWRLDAPEAENVFPGDGPGELWRWPVGGEPEVRLAAGVDFGSPLLWLPAAGGR